MIGVPIMLPNTPPFVIVKVPPTMSSNCRDPSFAFFAYSPIDLSTSAKLISPAFQSTGTTNPVGEATATDTSMKSW